MNFYILWLSKIFGYNNKELIKFFNFINPKEAFNLTSKVIDTLPLNDELKRKILSTKLKDETKKDFEYCQKNNIKLIDFTSSSYPVNLLNIPSFPPLLYCIGNISPKDEISISIVGSRKYTNYGEKCAKLFASKLSYAGITIVSGMACGIDSFAHCSTINSKGRTIAVLGSGIETIYPKENTKLYYDIIKNGAVISEFPLSTPPLAKNFPIRNRIVAGLSLGTLVIEANKKSGTMITARLAAEYGRNVYAIPGNLFNSTSIGTNLLIKDGAKIITDTEDILEDIHFELSKLVSSPKQLSLFNKNN